MCYFNKPPGRWDRFFARWFGSANSFNHLRPPAHMAALVRRSLWEEIESMLRPQEIDEVRRAIGPRRIDANEQLMKEMLALEQVLDDFRRDNAEEAARSAAQARLRERPGASFLRDQIKMLVDALARPPPVPTHMVSPVIWSRRATVMRRGARPPKVHRATCRAQTPAVAQRQAAASR